MHFFILFFFSLIELSSQFGRRIDWIPPPDHPHNRQIRPRVESEQRPPTSGQNLHFSPQGGQAGHVGHVGQTLQQRPNVDPRPQIILPPYVAPQVYVPPPRGSNPGGHYWHPNDFSHPN